MSEQHGNDTNKEDKKQAANGGGQGKEQAAHDGAGAGGAAGERKADGWDGVNDGIDRAEADVSQMMDDLEYIRAKVRVLRGRYG
jgi:hypothetical protein